MTSAPRLRIAIVGGGIGGLCLAVALSKHADIQIDLYEAAGQFSEIGAGVMFWARTWKIFEQLGLADDLAKVAGAPVDEALSIGLDFRRSDAPTPGSRFAVFRSPYGCIRFHRAHFLDVLVDHLPKGVAHFGKRLASYSETAEGVELAFTDGSSASFDVLIGCDGIKSTIRKQMYEEEASKGKPHLLQHVDPIWSGTMTYRSLIPAERLQEVAGHKHRVMDDAIVYCGKSKHVVSYGIGKGANIVNLVAIFSDPKDEGKPFEGPWVVDCSPDDVRKAFQGWEPEVQQLLTCVDKATLWSLHFLRPLPFYVTSRVALLGDAAHAMLPHQGAGAGQAIEDAYILANILGDPSVTPATISHALKAYEDVRLPFANARVEDSRVNGLLYQFNSEHEDRLETLGPTLENRWNWLWETSLEEEVQQALGILGAKLQPTTWEMSKL
ncbi:FAD/NAD-P-binding domain-containing protein [Cristinia sonorae]|uniref:FAD/NAD-P-binding domain-containing protein n=1 Tax=Cristinia sonorae TaxID=1940300 RepID=A0A8K0UYV9_9AGAR|nr:FAD/NAD-P-binding domain-containing protein [Cristinia sonorae]